MFAGLFSELVLVDAQRLAHVRTYTDGIYKITSGPVLSRGLALVGNKMGYVAALSVNNGEERWQFEIEHKPLEGSWDWIEAFPAVSNDRVVISGPDGWVYGLDLATGEKRWSFAAKSKTIGSPVIAGTVVYVMFRDGHLRALDITRGKKLWEDRFPEPSRAGSSPAICEGRLYIALDEKLYAFGR